MSFSRSEFRGLSDVKKSEQAHSQLPALRALVAVAPKMEQLTRDENWNTYCGYLSGIREKLVAARDAAQMRLCGMGTVGHEQMLEQKLTFSINEAQIQILNLALDLPKAILENSEHAQKLLAKWNTPE